MISADVAFVVSGACLWAPIPPSCRRPMNENPPDRLSSDPKSPCHDPALLERGVGIRFNGAEKNNVEEYCVSEGWIRVPAGNAKDRNGNPMTIRLKGKVEPYFRQAT